MVRGKQQQRRRRIICRILIGSGSDDAQLAHNGKVSTLRFFFVIATSYDSIELEIMLDFFVTVRKDRSGQNRDRLDEPVRTILWDWLQTTVVKANFCIHAVVSLRNENFIGVASLSPVCLRVTYFHTS